MPHDDPPPAPEPHSGTLERTIPDPGFADDTGAADPVLRRLLDGHRAGTVSSGDVLAVLQDARLLVPVVAVLGDVEHDERGLAHDKSSDMAAVLVRAADGSTGLLAFTSTETMARWDPSARPVPVTAATAATAAIQDGAEALLVDLAGPATYVVDGEDLARLGAGWRLVALGDARGGHGWIGPSTE
ncbi:SseB family protein [Nocardioides sp. SYSU D00065]|uniref:SseB family protein n=1 Tax=Nocardioides sp. SYSU D00065 TaxID=2817378 RepID=UPI0027DDB942|nr:SseB family protein [Nocardioides sp. SYSU D00065]